MCGLRFANYDMYDPCPQELYPPSILLPDSTE